jgi:hypothetical protein
VGVMGLLMAELKETIKKYNLEDLQLLIREMYKVMPKKLREEKNIDELLRDVHGYSVNNKGQKKDPPRDFNELISEVDCFIEYAYKQYYFAPNVYVHKKERPKWRFKAREYIKSLQEITALDEHRRKATDYLEKLYELLSYACGYYLFSTDNPFRSVGIEQLVFLDMVIKRKFMEGINQESIKSVINLVINSNTDPNTYSLSLIYILVDNLKSPDAKEMAIEVGEALMQETYKAFVNQTQKQRSFKRYHYDNKISRLVETIFALNMELCEYQRAIGFFNANYKASDNEVRLYVLLTHLYEYDLKDHWLSEYEKAVKKGVIPRESLREKYACLKKNGDWHDELRS